jgi:hypothetical protein
MDDGRAGEPFFDMTVGALDDGVGTGADRIVITSFKRRDELREDLLRRGVAAERICATGGITQQR